MLSGDIETQPGPNRRTKPRTHIIHAMMVLIIIINQIKKVQVHTNTIKNKETGNYKETNPKTTNKCHQLQEYLNHSSYLLTEMNKRRKINPPIRSTSAYLSILLIMSGDLHPNPGPLYQKNCLICKHSKKNKLVETCETCKQWSHLSCMTEIDVNAKLEKSFEWICPNLTCTPNHHIGIGKELKPNFISTENKAYSNRYEALKEEDISKKQTDKETKQSKKRGIGKKKESKKTMKLNKKKGKQINLLKYLTKIKPKEYQGHQLCNECNKRINEGSKQMECIECERCTHRRCSKIKSDVYREVRNLWTCNKCLKIEDMPENTKFSKEKFATIDGTKITTMDELKEMKIKQKKSMLWIHFNCRSIQNAHEELEVICSTVSPEIVLLTETWMDDSNPDAAYIPKGYQIKRKDRSEVFKHKYGKKRGGGVAILHKENISATAISSLNTEEDETLWIKVKDKQKTLLVACTYRTSYCDLLEGGTTKLEKNIIKASSLSKNIMLFGDLNCDLNETDPDKPTRNLLSCMSEMNLHQMITGATRIESGKPRLIDHIWIEEQMTEAVETSGICTGISDHAGIYIFIKGKSEEEETITCRNYKNYEKEQLCEDFNKNIENSNFKELITAKHINKATECWTKCFQEAIEKNAPMRTFKKTRSPKLPWFTEVLRRLIERKNTILQLWYLYRKNEDRTIYRKLKNQVNHLKKKLISIRKVNIILRKLKSYRRNHAYYGISTKKLQETQN